MILATSEDAIRDTVSARADQLGFTANAISVRLGGHPTPQAVRRYLTGRCSLNTRYVSRICSVLRLELRPRK